MFKHLSSFSLLSKAKLQQAREHYSPLPASTSSEQSLSRWTERLLVQSEHAGAREIAGLADEELGAMQAEFERRPSRALPALVRLAVATGLTLAVLGGLPLLVQALTGTSNSGALSPVQVVGAASLLIGLTLASAGMLAAFAHIPLELCHGRAGLYFGRLDEHHPWLYKTLHLRHHPGAEAYRLGVLRDRGCLRGVDFVMMREIVETEEAREQLRTNRSVAEELQLLPGAAVRPGGVKQPRLVRTKAGSTGAPHSGGLKQVTGS